MKFLVTVSPLAGVDVPDPLGLAKQSKIFFSEAMEQGIVECMYQFTNGEGSVAVIQVDSEETAWAFIATNPSYAYGKYEVKSLVDGLAAFDQFIEMMEELMSG